MIANLFLYLVIAGFTAEAVVKARFERVWSLLLFTVMAALLLNFYENWQLGFVGNFSQRWIDSSLIHININLSSNPANYVLIAPFFLVSGLMVFNNTFYSQEVDKLRLNGFLVLNLAAIILMVCSENVIQLLTAVCIIDVLCLSMINDIEGKRRYVFYNLLADMALFSLFAVVWGQTGSFALADLDKYNQPSYYPELAVFLLLFCVFIKSGMFLFQGGLINLSDLSFNRLKAVSYCATPAAGILLLIKAYPLLSVSAYSGTVLGLFAAFSIVWAFLGAVCIDNLKEKTLYFNIMFYALFIGLLSLGLENALNMIPMLLVLGYLLNSLWMMIGISASNEFFVSNMGGFIHSLKISFFLAMLLFFALIQTLLKDVTIQNQWWIFGFLGSLLLAAAQILRQIFLGESHSDERVWAFLKNSSVLYLLPALIITGLIIRFENYYTLLTVYVFAGFVIIMVAGPLRFLDRVYEIDAIQEADWFDKIYETLLVAPVKILGRILWLTIDFLIIERTIISSLTGATNLLIGISRRLHNGAWLSGFFFTMTGLLIFVTVFYLKVNK